ncbi:MAG: hypothetical protein KGY75_01140 [Candidatus Cloacimonetes bacterium]|nr:hypothetical protein [Candidatus Cloacimonadota bacterium]MBS3766716.1 hypothetical protein [Candidatus Cloacimonadota bacterium]
MKKVVIIIVCLLISSSVFAFEEGTKAFGGGVDFNSFKSNSDADARNTFMADVFGGYFLINNVMAKAMMEYYNSSHGDDFYSEYLFGLGGDYFYDHFFAGAAFLFGGSSYSNASDHSSSAMYLDFNAGYLFEIVESVFFKLQGDYIMGLGEYGGDSEGDNEETEFSLSAGISVFMP